MPRLTAFFFFLVLATIFPRPVFSDIESGEQASYEKIYDSFIREDYQTAYELAHRYLSREKSGARYEDVQYLEALSLIKLGKTDEGNQKFEALENRPASKNFS